MSYILVNPFIEKNTIKSKQKSSSAAAEDIWSQFSTNVKNFTPEFYFSFIETGSNKLHHYKVNETLENNKVKYSLQKYNSKKINDKDFINALFQDGGKGNHHRQKRYKKYDDDSSSSSSSSSEDDDDDLRHRSHRPIRY
jgi:hypothetical protein